MRIEDLASDLATAYERAAHGDKVVSIYLFGIRNAADIAGKSPYEIALRAGLPRSYGTEIAKAVRLAEHVILR